MVGQRLETTKGVNIMAPRDTQARTSRFRLTFSPCILYKIHELTQCRMSSERETTNKKQTHYHSLDSLFGETMHSAKKGEIRPMSTRPQKTAHINTSLFRLRRRERVL